MQSDQDTNKKQPETEREPITPIEPIDRASNCPPNKQVANCKANDRQDTVDDALIKWTAALVRWTAALVFVAIISAGISTCQWNEMRSAGNQTNSMIAATQTLASAAASQATTTQSQLGVMQGQLDEMRVEQRPFVYLAGIITKVVERIDEPACCGPGITLFQIPSNQRRKKVIAVSFLIGNSGNSQTQRLQILPQCIRNPAIPMKEPFSKFKWHENVALRQVIAPKQIIEITGCDLPEGAIMDYQMGTIREYLIGEIRYGDRSSIGQPYITQFESELHVTDGWNDISKFNGFTIGVGQHNCTDKDCPK